MTVSRSLLIWLILTPLIFVNVAPFVIMILTAIKPADEVFTFPPRWLPSRIAWENFPEMWVAANFGRALMNSLVVSVLSTLLALSLAVPFAYALSRFSFRGKGVLGVILLATQMLSPVVLVLGLFRLVVAMGLNDTHAALVIYYAAFNLAFAVWMLRSYFDSIPLDIEEAAWVEGATRGKALVMVFLPLALPAMAVTAIFSFINAWNDFVLALTILRTPDKATITLEVVNLVAGRYDKEWQQIMAAALVATLPVTLMFAWLQKYLLKGLSGGAVK
jgi:multiple sugar transport system permease protein